MQAETRIAWLLRTVDETAVDWDGRSTGGGVILMPSMWTQGSYAELERRLRELSDRRRPLWWHAVQRYRAGETRRLVLPLRSLSGRRDPRPLLPANARLVADGKRDGRRRARASSPTSGTSASTSESPGSA